MSPRPRIRSIKPEAWQDEKVGALSRDARLLMVGLITMADDEGRLRAQPSMILGHVFPWDEIPPRKLGDLLSEIAGLGVILQYEHNSRPYIAFRHWRRHQQINKPTASELPPPPDPVVVEENRPRPKIDGERAEGGEGYRKAAIPQATRRAVARRHGAEPGQTTPTECESCGALGSIYWPRVRSGKPGSWVQFIGLELDHIRPEPDGGSHDPGNISLLCVSCNRRKGSVLPGIHDPQRADATTPKVVAPSGSESCSPAGTDRIGSEGKGTEPELLSSDEPAEDEVREDVERLCHLLANLIRGNDPKAKIAPDSKGWRDAMRLLIDKDGRSEAAVERIIRWSQADEFWRSNILSAPKLREQFTQLALKASRNGRLGAGPSAEDFLAIARGEA